MTEADPGPGPARRRWARGSGFYTGASVVLFAAGIAGLVLAVRDSWTEISDHGLPGWPLMLLAVVAMGAFLALAERGWTGLFEGRGDRRRVVRAFYLSQLGKYIPGGVWQPAGQVGMSTGDAVSTRRATLTFGLFAAQLAAAGAVVAGIGLALSGSGMPVALRIVAGLVGIGALALRPALLAASRLLPARWRPDPASMPSDATLRRGLAWSVGAMVAQGAAFAVLLAGLAPHTTPAPYAPAFVAAWLVGFLAVPVPAGVGIREAVLVGLLSHHVAVATILVASLAQRSAAIIADVGALAAVSVAAPRRGSARPVDGAT